MEKFNLEILSTYKNPLIWKFNCIDNNIKYMYGKNDELKITFFIFFQKDDKYFIDVGCCYKFGDFDHGRFDYFNYGYVIKSQIELGIQTYESLLNELNSLTYVFVNCVVDYCLLDEDGYIEGYKNIKINDKVFWYEIDEDVFFVDNNTHINYIEQFYQYVIKNHLL